MEMIVVGVAEEDVADVFQPYTKWSQSLGRLSRRKAGVDEDHPWLGLLVEHNQGAVPARSAAEHAQ